jgi:hypothetical protein
MNRCYFVMSVTFTDFVDAGHKGRTIRGLVGADRPLTRTGFHFHRITIAETDAACPATPMPPARPPHVSLPHVACSGLEPKKGTQYIIRTRRCCDMSASCTSPIKCTYTLFRVERKVLSTLFGFKNSYFVEGLQSAHERPVRAPHLRVSASGRFVQAR